MFAVFSTLASLLLVGLLGGCAHTHPKGTVVTGLGPQEVVAHLGSGDVRAGDRVELLRADCREHQHGREVGDQHCKRVPVGEGQVVRNLSDDFSLVRLNPGTPASVGLLVEKK